MSLVPTSPASAVPAGWYPDPQGSFQQRWWNGTAWTNEFAQYRPTLNYTPAVQLAADQASPAQLQAAAQVAAAFEAVRVADLQQASYTPQYGAIQSLETQQSPEVLPSRSSVQTLEAIPTGPQPGLPQEVATPALAGQPTALAPIPQFPGAMPSASTPALVPSTPASSLQPSRAVNPSVFDDYNPFGMIPEVRSGVRDRPVKRLTAAVFLLALVPAVVVAGAVALASYLPEFYTLFAQVALAAVLIVALLGLAAIDRRALKVNGHESTAWAALALIPPVYFIARTVIVTRETGRGSPLPLVLAIVVLLGIGAAFVLEPSLIDLISIAN